VTPRRLALPLALLLAAPLAAEPAPPPGGRFSFGGEASFALSPEDPTFFNYTDYEYTALRLARLSLAGSVRLHERVSVLAEARVDNFGEPRIHAAYARFKPWADRDFDLQAGVIPPVFGSYPRRAYAADNYLIGHPLAYQYLTSLRPDAMPGSELDLLRMRGRGWRPAFPVGSQEIAPGMPLASTLRWDTGVQARVGAGPMEALVAVTRGTLSSPRIDDDNEGLQLGGRVVARPVVGLVLGASAARGAYASEEPFAGTDVRAGDLHQTAWGLDAEYSRGYWLVRAEAVWSRWDLPEPISAPVRAQAVWVEGRYKLLPGFYLAARADHLGFSRLAGGETWDAPVLRLEGGGGYNIRRHVLLKAAYQYNRRDGGRMRSLGLMAGQLLLWF
jgi:hypothetical protein